VNVGAAAHSITLNQGNGAAETGLALTNDQVAVGVTSADPAATTLCTGSLLYSLSTHLFTCQAANSNGAGLLIQTGTDASCTASCTKTFPTAYVSAVPICFCTGINGSCNVATGGNASKTTCAFNASASGGINWSAIGAP
jgi:hypothetical protein